MIDLYTYTTSNGQRAAIMLEESGFPYQVHRVELPKREHKQEPFLAINPLGQIPAIVDHDVPGGNPITLTQSNAIIFYLAEKSGRLLPRDAGQRAKVLECFIHFVTDISAPLAQGFYLRVLSPVKVPEAAEPLHARASVYIEHLDRHLAEHEYLAGPDYSIADVSAYPTIAGFDEANLQAVPNVKRWRDTVGARSAVIKGMVVGG